VSEFAIPLSILPVYIGFSLQTIVAFALLPLHASLSSFAICMINFPLVGEEARSLPPFFISFAPGFLFSFLSMPLIFPSHA
jgi:hypothetical protein